MQISGFEAKDVQYRASGICWRCDADRRGKGSGNGSGSAAAREEMRPALDKAIIVEGLEEGGPEERRRRAERSGECWFCGASAGCASCGKPKWEGEGELTGFRRDRIEGRVDKGKKRAQDADMGQSGSSKRVRESSMTGHLAILANPFVPRPLDGQQQFQQQNDYNEPGARYGQPAEQLTQTYNFEGQGMQFQAGEPQNAFGDWQNMQGLHLSGFGEPGGQDIPIDPALEQLQGAEQVQQSFGVPNYQNGEFPPIPDFGADAVSLPFYLPYISFPGHFANSTKLDGIPEFDLGDMTEESFISLLEGLIDPSLFKLDVGEPKPEAHAPEASNGNESVASTLPSTQAATQPATQAPENPYADQFAVPTKYPNMGWLPF